MDQYMDEQKQEEINLEKIPDTQLSESQKKGLIDQANEFHQHFKNFEENYATDMKTEHYYLLSLQFLTQWKAHVSYAEVIEMKQPSRFLGGQNLTETVNQDLLENKALYLNQFLKEGLVNGKDFIIVDRAVMDFFDRNYEVTFISRPVSVNQNGDKIVEIYLRKINCLIVDNDILFSLDPVVKRADQFQKFQIQISSNFTIPYLYELIQSSIQSSETWRHNVSSFNEILRIWKLNSQITIQDFTKNVREVLGNTKGRDYKVEFPGIYVDQSTQKIIDQFNFLPEDVFILEIKKLQAQWCFQNEQLPLEEKCQFCSQYKILKVKCICLKVAYCNDVCQEKDKYYHSNKCQKAGEEDAEALAQMELTQSSQLGVVGLRNLGNTCFMNSGLQCLSKTKELVQYILAQKYKAELNIDNPIGSQGKVANAFAHIVLKMYYGTEQDFAPYEFKRAIGSFQQMFSGYSQHDAHELNGYLLDALHEDLNKVLQKPSTENQDSNGRPDFIVAREYWGNFKKRNDSFIVDLMFGQSKSRLQCPDCKKVSITFDPYLSISLPIPQGIKQKQITVHVLGETAAQIPTKMVIEYEKAKGHQISDLRLELAETLKTNAENLLFKIVSTYSLQSDPTEDMETNAARKKAKYRNFTCRRLLDWEISIPNDLRIAINFRITYCSTYSRNQNYRREFTLYRTHIYNKEWSTKEIHLKFYQEFQAYFTEFTDPQQSDEENYQSMFLCEDTDKQLWRLLNQANYSYYENCCYFCGVKSCNNCNVPFSSDLKLSDILAKVPETEKSYVYEMELYIRKINGGKDIEKMFDQEIESQDKEESQQNVLENDEEVAQTQDSSAIAIQDEKKDEKKDEDSKLETVGKKQKKGISLYECFELFRAEEVLDKENPWYCSNCKDFKQATKQMEIYKAPKILIIHLKRFKGQGTYFRSQLAEVIEFPVRGLNLKDYILNHSHPEDFEKENETFVDDQSLHQDTDLLYDLYGVSNHYGSLGGGHYTAYALNFHHNQWYHHDDSRVSEVSENDIVSEAAYVLFYRQRN